MAMTTAWFQAVTPRFGGPSPEQRVIIMRIPDHGLVFQFQADFLAQGAQNSLHASKEPKPRTANMKALVFKLLMGGKPNSHRVR